MVNAFGNQNPERVALTVAAGAGIVQALAALLRKKSPAAADALFSNMGGGQMALGAGWGRIMRDESMSKSGTATYGDTLHRWQAEQEKRKR